MMKLFLPSTDKKKYRKLSLIPPGRIQLQFHNMAPLSGDTVHICVLEEDMIYNCQRGIKYQRKSGYCDLLNNLDTSFFVNLLCFSNRWRMLYMSVDCVDLWRTKVRYSHIRRIPYYFISCTSYTSDQASMGQYSSLKMIILRHPLQVMIQPIRIEEKCIVFFTFGFPVVPLV